MDISKEAIKQLLPDKPVILDIGCYNGKDAAELATVCNTEVHCFECDPWAIEEFKKQENAALILWPYAITTHHGYTMYNQASKIQSGSLRKPLKHKKIWPDVKFKKGIKVACTTLDSWHTHVLKSIPIDLIWCDCNGGEAEVIMGGSQALSVTKYLYIEFCEVELYERALNRQRMCKALPGFEMIGEYNFQGNFGNILFRNKNKELWEANFNNTKINQQ